MGTGGKKGSREIERKRKRQWLRRGVVKPVQNTHYIQAPFCSILGHQEMLSSALCWSGSCVGNQTHLIRDLCSLMPPSLL